MAKNSAAVLYGPYDLRIEEWPMPEINDNEVLIEISCVGICGSDLKLYSTGECGTVSIAGDPIVVGHEGAGTVVQVGSSVTNLRVGDRVAIEPTQPCRGCEYCKRGRYNLCAEPRYCSTRECHGNITKYYKHVADFCHKIPDNVSMEEGAAVQPLAIAIHACRRAGVTLGARVLVQGAGPVGVLCALTARAMGAAKIMITDVVQSRLDTAREMVADYTLLTSKMADEDVVGAVVDALGDNPDITIDACGFGDAQRVALMVTKTGGTVMIVGIGARSVELPLTAAMLREVDVRGAYRLLNSYPIALAALESGAIDLKKFITHHYPMEQAKEAFEYAKSGDAMKIIIHMK
ncbi:sorbitol dehydrogenase-like [Aricia agestis]|uniref:sorbitol dehydrogenase-like n=1 Tax=Aricia agestis TaxID=91739 RepID=UPI001C201D1F|nr:sorbitol dehydrogenase-like [Aricia agestis]